MGDRPFGTMERGGSGGFADGHPRSGSQIWRKVKNLSRTRLSPLAMVREGKPCWRTYHDC